MTSALAPRGLVLVVNYNQAREIGAFLDELKVHWPADQSIVVDDASVDNSPAIAAQRGYAVLAHPRNLGVGAAIRTGIRHARQANFDFVIICAANGKMKPRDFAALAAPIAGGEADYVAGNRYLAGGHSTGLTPFRRLAIPLFSLAASLVLRRYFSDVTCGLRAYRLSLFDDPRVNIDQEWLDRYELEYYVQYWAVKKSLRIKEVPVTMDYSHLEKGRKSKIKPIVGWWSMIRPFLWLAMGYRK